MPLPMDIATDSGVQRLTLDTTAILITSKTPIQVDPKVFYIKKVIME